MLMMEGKSLPFLSAEELSAYRKPEKILPRREPKDTPTAIGSLPNIYLEQTTLLKEERVEKLGSLARGSYDASDNSVELAKPQGKFWHSMGYRANGKLMLYPEEALFLMETTRLEVYEGKVPLSIQEAYAKLLDNTCPVEQYHVYAHLSRLGYIVIRHQGSFNITPYERNIGLHSHLYSSQKKAATDSVPETQDIEEITVIVEPKPETQNKVKDVITLTDSPETKKPKVESEPDVIVIDDDDIGRNSQSPSLWAQSKCVKVPPVPFPNMAGRTILHLEIPHSSLLPPNVKLTEAMCTVDIRKFRSAAKRRKTRHSPYKGPQFRRGFSHRGQQHNQDPRLLDWKQNLRYMRGRNSYQNPESLPYRGGHHGGNRNLGRDSDSYSSHVDRQRPPLIERVPSPFHNVHLMPHDSGFRGEIVREQLPVPFHQNIFNDFGNRTGQGWEGAPHTSSFRGFNNRVPVWQHEQQPLPHPAINRIEDRWSGFPHDLPSYNVRDQRWAGPLDVRGCHMEAGDRRFLPNFALLPGVGNNIHNEQRLLSHTNMGHGNIPMQSAAFPRTYQDNVMNDQRWNNFPLKPSRIEAEQVAEQDIAARYRRDHGWEGLPNHQRGVQEHFQTANIETDSTRPQIWENAYNIRRENNNRRTHMWDHPPNHKNFHVRDRRDIIASSGSNNSNYRQRWDNSPQTKCEQSLWRKEHPVRKEVKLENNGVHSQDRRASSGDTDCLQQNEIILLDCDRWRDYKKQLASNQDIESLKVGPAASLWNGPVAPLVEPKEGISSARVLETVRTVKPLGLSTLPQSRFSSCSPTLKIAYDVYLPNSGFVKTRPKFPNHRIIVTRVDDPFPNLADIGAPLAALDDGVPLHFAVVDNGRISFYSFNDVSLPIQIGVG